MTMPSSTFTTDSVMETEYAGSASSSSSMEEPSTSSAHSSALDAAQLPSTSSYSNAVIEIEQEPEDDLDKLMAEATITAKQSYNLTYEQKASCGYGMTHKRYRGNPDDVILNPGSIRPQDPSHVEYRKGRPTNNLTVLFQAAVVGWYMRHRTALRRSVLAVFLIAYTIYFIYALQYSKADLKILIVITACVVLGYIYAFLRDTFGPTITRVLIEPAGKIIDANWSWLQWWIYVGLVLAVVYYMCFFVLTEVRQVRSVVGMFLFIMIPYCLGRYPDKVIWRPVIWGLGLQFILGILVLRWEPGYYIVKWAADEISRILAYSFEGASLVWGDPFMFFHPFFCLVIPMVIYIGAILGVFYYIGLTQWFCSKMGWLMSVTLKTTGIESVCLAANIFLSVMDILLMLHHYVKFLTPSEFFTFLVGSHSSIAGFAFGIIILFGVKSEHLLAASVMSAPAAVAIAKLTWPETKKSVFKDDASFRLSPAPEHMIYEACMNGAWAASKMGASIAIDLMAFFALYAWLDEFCMYIFECIGQYDVQLHVLLAYPFVPFVWFMGVDDEDIHIVATLLGLKVIANEFLAYYLLGVSIRSFAISERSSAIATYALCGFSSLGTLFIFVGVWGTLDKSKTAIVAQMTFRILMSSNLACFLTACIAGMFYNQDLYIRDTQPAIVGEFILSGMEDNPSWKDIFAVLGMDDPLSLD